MTARLRTLKAVLGGDIYGDTLLCPTIGHPPKDRGTSYTDRPGAPGGLLAKVHNGNGRHDDLAAKDRALLILGEVPEIGRRRPDRRDPIAEMRARAARQAAEDSQQAEILRRQQLARRIWDAAQSPKGTLAEHYLRSRSLGLPDDIAGHVIRFDPRGRWEGGTAPMLIAAMRCVRSGELRAIHRTALTENARKRGRKMLGRASGAAVMLDPEDAITTGLAIGEGIESCLAARQIGIRPTWAMGSSGGIASFPVLPGIECLTALAEIDGGASAKACREVGTRWHQARRHVDIITPRVGSDMNDVLMEGGATWR